MTQPPAVISAEVCAPDRRARYQERRSRYRRRRTERIARDEPVSIGLWIPSTVIFAILAPFAVMLTPLLYFAPRDVIPSPPRVIAGIGAVLLSLGGTIVEVDAPGAHIRFHLF